MKNTSMTFERLFKANIELKLQVDSLLPLPENAENHVLFDFAHSIRNSASHESQGVPCDVQFLVTKAIPPAVKLRLLQHRHIDLDLINQLAIRNQVIIMGKLARFLNEWHLTVMEILRDQKIDSAALREVSVWPQMKPKQEAGCGVKR